MPVKVRSGKLKVAYVYPYAFHYRTPFHERVRAELASQGVEYDVIYSKDPRMRHPRGDLLAPAWARSVHCHYIRIGNAELRYQRAFVQLLTYDLVIVQQENGLLLNYPLQLLLPVLGKKVAFFGHGRNFQSGGAHRLREWFKRLWINKVDWWFAYTESSAAVVRQAGFPGSRITVFNNALDTSSVEAEVAEVDASELEHLRSTMLQNSTHVGIYIGALYPLKRIPFLIEAAEHIRKEISDFHLIVVGAGTDTALVEEGARAHNWIHYMGPQFGRQKAMLAGLAQAFLMPGAVGLAVLDAFAYRLPMITTSFPFHGPEAAYLRNGENSVVLEDEGTIQSFSAAVSKVLMNAEFRERLAQGAATDLNYYSIESMTQRFTNGVMEALSTRDTKR